MNSYIVFIDRVHRETVLVTASSEDAALEKVVEDRYDDIIDSECMGWVTESATMMMDEEDVEWGED